MKKRYLFSLSILVLLLVIYLLGPRPNFAAVNAKIEPLDIPLNRLEAFIANKERKITNLKLDNEAKITWADSIRKTEWSIVYLHGFSASRMEGDPFHRIFAKRYACNLYMARLAGHGIDDKESFVDLTPEAMVSSAKEAIAIGRLLGEKVLVVSCSTGSTLSAYLAAENPFLIDAQMFFAPNFALEASGTGLMIGPWGYQLSEAFLGGKYRKLGLPANCHPYWTKEYRIEGPIALVGLLDQTMKEEVWSKTSNPFYIGYYYKDEENYDGIVSIPSMKRFYEIAQTPQAMKHIEAFPNVGVHPIISGLQSRDIKSVLKSGFDFAENVLKMTPKK